MAIILKYLSFIQHFDNCPPPQCKEINANAFRFVFADKSDSNNFKPVLLIKPSRILNKKFHEEQMKCSGYALSFFNSKVNATIFFTVQNKRNPNVFKTIGDSVAEIFIEINDGVATEPAASGHFDFFEYSNTNFYDKIKNIEKLNP